MKIGIVVSGLPASGKTTVAREIARRLGLTFLDKDDFLEDLYDRHGVASWEQRKRLSRQSDEAFRRKAGCYGSAVLVSHWRPLHGEGDSGTPVDWLEDEYDLLVEVFCQCPPDVALARFRNRKRHAGHFDAQRNIEALNERMRSLAGCFPLRLGTLVRIETDEDFDLDALEQTIKTLISKRA